MTTTAPMPPQQTSADWARRNLFPNWWSGLITIVLVPLILYLIYRGLRFFFVTGQWEAVRRNLTLFMQGTFSRDDQWRLISQILLFALAFGIGAGTNTSATKDRAEDAGLPYERSRLVDTLKRMWSLVAFIGLLLFFASSDDVGNLINPLLVVGAAVVVGYVGYQAYRLPRRLRNLGWLLTVTFLVIGFQVVSGFDAGGWVPFGFIFGITAYSIAPVERFDQAWLRAVAKLAAAGVVVIAIRALYAVIDSTGIGWDKWSGLNLTLMVSAIAIVLAFPLGLLLALARRSTLPALRMMATVYIETIRGVPLITLLFMGQFILGFVVPAGTTLSAITRAIAVMTFFRGGVHRRDCPWWASVAVQGTK